MKDSGRERRGRERVVAIVGATGAVGAELLSVLDSRGFPCSEIRPFASARSAGSRVTGGGREWVVQPLGPDCFDGVELALFSAGAAVSERYAPLAVEAGATVVDNTSHFRMQDGVPLVVPEVNPETLADHQGIVANPNCSTIQLVVALQPLRTASRLRRLVVTTYQAASGAGRRAMDELRDQTVDLLSFRDPKVSVHPRRLAFDCLPQIGPFRPDGSTQEEWKMAVESRKILGEPDLGVSVTCVRVPVFVGHAVCVHAEFEAPLPVERARELLGEAPGIVLAEGDADYPTAANAAGRDEVFVGRLRADPSCAHGLCFWTVADNLRKGAATNAVQVAECLLERDLLSGR